ncbi:MAG TPA: choice-of-anchor Q domain-containing protein [Solirubrobacterales bacterium]|nr:choice-of-anchor Q domain-containing protein [Solirubrobacterales bacterium]
MRRLLGLVLFVLCAACVPAGSAVADPYPVTSTENSGEGSLRAAILAANAHTGADTIPIEVTGAIELQSALQVIFDPVAIVGPGAGQLAVRRAAAVGPGFSIFGFSPDASPSSLGGLTVSYGQAAFGGGIRNSEGSLTLTRVVVRGNEAIEEGGTEAGAEGGGVYSEGPLTLRETVVTENTARASGGSTLTKALGGGVVVTAPLTVEASTISGNVAEASGDGNAVTAQGGGLLGGTEATISRSTISGNSVDADGGASQLRAQGGGVQSYEATISASTLAGNSATSAGLSLGANLYSILSTSVRDTIVADALGEAGSCSGTPEIDSGGFNLDEDGSCEFEAGSDLSGVPAGLDPVLRDNGGPTPTHALLPGSIAIDRGSSFGETVDQRGLPRPSDFPAIGNKEGGDGSDIGAFELQVPPAGQSSTAILVSAEPGDRTPPRTRIVSGPARVGFERLARFRFTSSEAQSTFRCKVDHRAWRRCASPYRVKVEPGKHFFRVRAIDRFGNVDRTAARFSWRVKPVG